MGSTLTGNTVASTYTGLLKTGDTGAVTSTLKTISDGSGNDSALQVSTTAVNTTGDLTVATNKFTVASATGNTGVLGNFAVNTNKFSVLAASGNTTVAGTLSVSGAVSLNNDLTTNSRIILNGNYGISQNAASGSNLFSGASTFSNVVTFTGGMQFQSAVNMTNNLTVAGVTTLNGNVVLGDAAGDVITVTGTPTFAQTATFNGIANFNGNVALGSDTSDTLTVNAVSTFVGNASFNGNTTIGSDAADTLTVNAAFNPATVTYDSSSDFVLIQDASDSNKIKKASIQSVNFIDIDLSSDASLSGGDRYIQLNNGGTNLYPARYASAYAIFRTDFVPTKYIVSYTRYLGNAVPDTAGFIIEWATSVGGTWTPVDSGFSVVGPANTFQEHTGTISIGSSPAILYWRLKTFDNNTPSGNLFYFTGFRMRLSNV